jgi:hypothetical protein
VIRSKDYNYGCHFFPVDSKQRSYQSGSNLVEFCRVAHAFHAVALPKTVSIIADLEMCKHVIMNTKFDLLKAKGLLDHLYAYKINPDNGKPVHDVHSNGADSFRYAVIATNIGLTVPVLHNKHHSSLPQTVQNYSRNEQFTNDGLPCFCD